MCLYIKIENKEELDMFFRGRGEVTRELLENQSLMWQNVCRSNEALNGILENYKEVAEDDIVCYKSFFSMRFRGHYYGSWRKRIGFYISHIKEWGCLVSASVLKIYRKNRLYHSDLPIRVDDFNVMGEVGYLSISHGIHAYIDKGKALDIYGGRVYKCIIPKGTVYCLGINGDIVAERMLITNKIVK